MTADPEMADFFAGGSRDSRIYSTHIPREEILDLRKESEELGEQKDWSRLTNLIKEAGESGKYKAVAIHDISTGGDNPEFRLVRAVPPEKWNVKPTEESAEDYGNVGDSIARFNAGEKISKGDRNRAANQAIDNMIEDAEMVDLMRELSEEEGREDEFPETEALAARVYRDQAQIRALQANRPPGMDSNLEVDWRDWPTSERTGDHRMEGLRGVIQEPTSGHQSKQSLAGVREAIEMMPESSPAPESGGSAPGRALEYQGQPRTPDVNTAGNRGRGVRGMFGFRRR